ARKSRATSTPAKPDRRQRAQHFLREQLARGPKPASVVEEAAAKAHIDEQALGQARGDLGIVTSRANTGGPPAGPWGVPGWAPEIGERRQARACTHRPVVSAFGQTGHRADMASGPSSTQSGGKAARNPAPQTPDLILADPLCWGFLARGRSMQFGQLKR